MDPLPQLSEEQVRAIVEEAGRWRKDVAAHAYGGDGARASVLGGVRSIEHGMLLDESILSLMADRGTFWCPTLSVFAPRTPEEEADAFFQRIQVRQRRAFRQGMELGVKIVFGTDAGAIRHGDNAVEFLRMVRLGMEPMAPEQVRAIVEEAGRWRKDVAAHAYGGDGARASVLGGVRSIEHGMLLDESILSLMADRGTFWCPTLSVFAPRTPEEEADAFFQRIQVRQRRAFRQGMELGVKIVFGTDAGAIRHGDNAVEFLRMVRLGMEPMVAIKSATSLAAELLRLEDTIGAIKPGLQADLIAGRLSTGRIGSRYMQRAPFDTSIARRWIRFLN